MLLAVANGLHDLAMYGIHVCVCVCVCLCVTQDMSGAKVKPLGSILMQRLKAFTQMPHFKREVRVHTHTRPGMVHTQRTLRTHDLHGAC